MVSKELVQLHDEIRQELLPAACGLYLGYLEDGVPKICTRGGGSACAISTPDGTYFVTCEHVLSGLRQRQLQDDRLFIVGTLNSWLFKLDPIQVCACNKDLDVAVFSAPTAIWLGGPPPDDWKARYFKVRFPIVVPKEGETVYLLGYPGEGRDVMRQDHVFLACEAASVSDRHCVFYPSNPRILTNRKSIKLPIDGVLGGASGGPAFVIRENGIHLVGVIKEGNSYHEPIWVALLKYLNADGTLDALSCPQDFNQPG